MCHNEKRRNIKKMDTGQIVILGLVIFYVAQAWDAHTRHQAMLAARKAKVNQKDK